MIVNPGDLPTNLDITMTFSLHIAVPTESDGWEGMKHLPTFLLVASTRWEAEGKVQDLIAHLPEGTTFTLVHI